MASDEDLMARVAAGETAALAELCRRYERPLYRFLARHVGSADAEDLYQETWLHAVRAASQFDRGRRFSTWLFQIALNLARDAHRRRRPEERDPSVLADIPAVDRPIESAEAGIDARRLLAALPESQRTVMILRYYHDMTESDVAAIVGCPPGTVKSRLHHAIRSLLTLTRDERGRPS